MNYIEATKVLHLNEELRNSIRLIKLGMGEIQNINLDNSFYHLPLQTLSSGVERFLKCYLCFGYHEKNNKFPDFKTLKDYGGGTGHDIVELKKVISKDYFLLRNDDENFIKNDEILEELLYLLSEFGKFSRYHNLDIVTSKSKPSVDVEMLWEKFETKILKENTPLYKRFFNFKIQQSNETYDFINSKIISILERFIRGLSRQFTFVNLGKLANKHSVEVRDFLLLKDSDLGKTIYKNISKEVKKSTVSSHKRTIEDDLNTKSNPDYKSKSIRKIDFKEDWPFYSEKVVLELRYKYWPIVSIDGYDYALNGSASNKFKLELVHDSGMTIYGKTCHKFIEMTLSL